MPYRVESDPNGPCVITFDSVQDFANAAWDAADDKTNTTWDRQYQVNRLEGRLQFAGVATVEDGQRLAARGLRVEGMETLELAQDVLKELQQERVLPEFAPVYDVSGMDVDIDRYLTGEPECMIEYPITELLSTGPVVTMVVGMNYSAITTKDAILAQGRLAVALAMALSACGYSLEIWSEIHTGACGADDTGEYDYVTDREKRIPGAGVERYPRGIKVRVKVLEAGTSIDPTGLTYALAHPSMLRIFGFAAMHLAPAEHQVECRTGRGYGIPRPIDAADWPDNAIILNPRKGQEATTENLRQDVLDYLTNLGILGSE